MNEPTPAALVERLMKLIERKGLTHRKVAAEMGVTVTTLSRWKNLRTAPDSEPTLIAIRTFIKKHS